MLLTANAEEAGVKTTIILINSEAFLVDLDQTGEVMKKHMAVPDYFSSKYAHETQVRRSMAKVKGLSSIENGEERRKISKRDQESTNLVMCARKKNVDSKCLGQSTYHVSDDISTVNMGENDLSDLVFSDVGTNTTFNEDLTQAVNLLNAESIKEVLLPQTFINNLFPAFDVQYNRLDNSNSPSFKGMPSSA